MRDGRNEDAVLEVCVGSLGSAIAARDGGADRIELCASPDVGGLTPEFSLAEAVVGAVDIPVHAMVRPGGGDFICSESEFDLMKESVAAFRRLGCAGIVAGILTAGRVPDAERTAMLVRLAGGMEVTFHRAIDETADILAAARVIAGTGVRRVLTSGGADDAVTGAPVIARLVSEHPAISVIAAGGLTVGNADRVVRLTGARELHSRSGVSGPGGEVDAGLVAAMKRAMRAAAP